MNSNLTSIGFVLDRSGSMDAMLEAAVAGFNGFLRDQQALPGDARLTLVHSWEFLFLGANQDAIATAARIGIAAGMAANFAADGAGLAAPLDTLVREEDAKQRGPGG
jgi:hypothetical protein